MLENKGSKASLFLKDEFFTLSVRLHITIYWRRIMKNKLLIIILIVLTALTGCTGGSIIFIMIIQRTVANFTGWILKRI